MKAKIAVLITCYNRKDKTLKCLSNLFLQEGIDDKFHINVFLVDDGSSDGTSESVKKFFPQVSIISGTGDLYWNRGMHLSWKSAVAFSKFDFFLWLNDDTLLFRDAIGEMLESYELAHYESIICGSTMSEVTNEHTYGGKTITSQILIPDGNLQEADIMEGNCVLISDKIFSVVGNIDPIFPHAIGDHDYGLRAKSLGFKIKIARKYIGYCEGHEALPKWCLNNVSFGERLKSLYSPLGNSHPKYFFIYEKRHFGALTALKHLFSIHLRVLIPTLWK